MPLRLRRTLSLLFLTCSPPPQEAFDGKENNNFHGRKNQTLIELAYKF